MSAESGRRTVERPVIDIPGRYLTQIDPRNKNSTMIMHIRPGWKELYEYIMGPQEKGG